MVDEPDEGQPEAGPIPVPTATAAPVSTLHQTRDFILERTGDAVRAIADMVDERHRSVLALAQDPLDNTLAPFILKPSGMVELIDPGQFDQYRARPIEITDNAIMTRLDSFIDMVNRFKRPASAVFAVESMTAPSLRAIIDYHRPEDVENAVTLLPQHGRHAVRYPFPLSKEWKAWIEQNGKPMGQAAFAQFIENHIVDIETVELEDLSGGIKTFVSQTRGKLASQTDIFVLSRGLTVHENSKIVEAVNLSTGEGEVTFQSEHVDAAGEKLNIPNMFIVCIPVWDRSPDVFRIAARLRYRKTPEGIKFWYELWRADLVFQTAFDEVIEQVKAETDLPVFIGEAG
jgi:uncharacterized protein YfdQ (DUF2303 family)